MIFLNYPTLNKFMSNRWSTRCLQSGTRHVRSGRTIGFFLNTTSSSSSPSSLPPKLRSFTSLADFTQYANDRSKIESLLFRSPSALLLFSFPLCLFTSPLLCPLLCCGNTRNNIRKWIVENSYRFDLRWATFERVVFRRS